MGANLPGTHYRLTPSWTRSVRPMILALLVSGAVIGSIRPGLLWARDHVFPPPDPIELHHRIEQAGAWPAMLCLTSKAFQGEKFSWTSGPDEPLFRAAWMNGLDIFKDEQGVSGVYFSFGGADNEYGVLVCRENATSPAGPPLRYTQCWGDGVWYEADNAPRVPRVVGVRLPRD
jgi:hypothetical protein